MHNFIILDGIVNSNGFNFNKFFQKEYNNIHTSSMWGISDIKKNSPNHVENLGGYDVFSLNAVLYVLSQRSKSKTLADKIEKMKEGSYVEMFRTSNTSFLIVYRLTEDERAFLERWNDMKTKLEDVNKQIQATIPVELVEKKKELESFINKMKKGKV